MSVNTNCLTSPGMLLPMSGIFSALFGITSSFGLLSFIGYPGCNLIFVIPFLVIGIGIDDMFIIYSSFQKAFKEIKKEDEGEFYLQKLLVYSLSKSGVSITITSLTDVIAFLVGLTTNFRGVQIFCLYVSFAILFCYFYQLTLFSGCLCLHIKRIQKNKNSIFICVNQDSFKCSKTNNELDTANTFKNDQIELKNNSHQENNDKIHQSNKTIGKFVSNTFYSLKISLKKLLKFLITKKLGKSIVVFIYFFYLTLSLYGAFKIKEGLNLSDLVSSNSHYHSYSNINFEHFDMSPIVMLVFNKPLNYDDMNVRKKIQSFYNQALQTEGIEKIPIMVNWLDVIDLNSKINYKHNIDNLYNKFSIFQNFKNDFYIEKKQITFGNITKWENVISGSRLYVKYSNITLSSKEAIPMIKLRELCEYSELPVIAYSVVFKVFEQFDETLPNILQSFLISMEAMYLISLIFIPDLVSVFCIMISMGSIMVGLIGSMYFWGLTVNSITMIELIMSIGFCVDFTAHVVHAFIASVGNGTRDERAYKACVRVGMPIISSALSTMLGISLLAFCESYIFTTFFKTLFILMNLGIINSLLFLPVMLSIFGPNWPRHFVKIKEDENNFINHTLNEVK